MILGAGVPRDAGRNKPKRNQPPLDSDFFDVARLGQYQQFTAVTECLTNLVGGYSDKLMESLETAATYLYLKAMDDKKNGEYHIGFVDFLYLLNEVLAGTTNDLSVGRGSLVYRFLLQELEKLNAPDDLTIITFNYDILIENVLDEIANSNKNSNAFVFPQCYWLKNSPDVVKIRGNQGFENRGTDFYGVAVLKLHGSMNWQSRHNTQTPTPSGLFNVNRKLHIVDSKELPIEMVWKRHKTMYMKPIITPPISGKNHLTHSAILPLWKKAESALQKADRVVIAGYSCPPMDIEARILISENLRQNESKKVYVIDPDAHSAAKFVDMCGVTHTTIYSSIKNWVDESPV